MTESLRVMQNVECNKFDKCGVPNAVGLWMLHPECAEAAALKWFADRVRSKDTLLIAGMDSRLYRQALLDALTKENPEVPGIPYA